MTNTTALRAAALAAITLLAATVALALSHRGGERATSDLPRPAGPWYPVLAAPYTPAKKRGACGVLITATAKGVAHPVLPCGVKIYVQYEGKTVLTQVIDRGPSVPGREFDLTRALAKQLGVTGTQTIRWRFAR